jgi:hypothetical protein
VVYLHDITNTTPWSSGDALNFTMMEHIAGNIRQDHLALVLNKCNDVLNDATNDNSRNLWSNPARAGPYVNGNVRDLPAKIIDNLLEIKSLSSLKFLEELREDEPLHLTSAGQHVVQKLNTQINLLQKRYEMAKAIRKADEKANHKRWSKESAQEKNLLYEIEKLTSKKRFMKMDRKDSTLLVVYIPKFQ